MVSLIMKNVILRRGMRFKNKEKVTGLLLDTRRLFMRIFTIGFTKKSAEEFFALLQSRNVK